MKERAQKAESKAAVLFPVVIIAIVSFAVYSNALSNGFIYDDHSQVLKNYLIRDIRNIPEIFLRSAWTFEGAPPTSNYYRPMLNLFYLFSYYAFGLDARGFHLLNILFHAANSVLVFFISAKLFGALSSPPQRREILSPPLLAGLLFATHPVHTEAVTWVAGLSDVSFAFFYLLAFYLYICSQGSFRWQYLFSVISFLLAILSKEPGLMLLGTVVAYDYAFRPPLHSPLADAKTKRGYYFKRYVPFLLVVCIYFVVRFIVLGGFTPLVRLGKLNTLQHIINVFPLFSQYLYKMFMPINLNFWPAFNPLTSLSSMEGITSLCVAIIFAGVVLLTLSRNKIIFLSLLLVIVPLAPALYIKGIIGKLFSERYLYVPSVGFAMLLAYLFTRRRTHNARMTKAFTIVFALMIGTYSCATISRNIVWKDEYSLFADTVRKSPDSVVPRLEFGNTLLAKGRFDEAIAQYQAAIRMEPMLYVIYHALGLAFAGKNEWYDAIRQYKIALALNPDSPEIHADLGRAYIKGGFRDEAVQEFRSAVQLQPTAANHNLLGIAYARAGQIGKATEEFRMANSLDPTQLNYGRNLAEAIELARSVGYRECWRLERRQHRSVKF